MIQKLTREEIIAATGFDVDGMTAHDRDEMAIPSYSHSNPLIRRLMWRRYELITEFSAFTPDASALEFGCGVGVFLPTLCRLAGSVSAIDLHPEFAQKLVENLGLDVTFIDDVAALDDASLDVIVAADVMEHMETAGDQASIFRDKLKPGGRLILSGPTENLAYKTGRVLAGFGGKGDYHVTNINALRGTICERGFRVTAAHWLPAPFLPPLFKIIRFEKA